MKLRVMAIERNVVTNGLIHQFCHSDRVFEEVAAAATAMVFREPDAGDVLLGTELQGIMNLAPCDEFHTVLYHAGEQLQRLADSLDVFAVRHSKNATIAEAGSIAVSPTEYQFGLRNLLEPRLEVGLLGSARMPRTIAQQKYPLNADQNTTPIECIRKIVSKTPVSAILVMATEQAVNRP